ncbi:MAG: hypothetical protein J6M47_04545 [Clostridia bacterium]|nr:hypothetical protein [Clostridia bacterium]
MKQLFSLCLALLMLSSVASAENMKSITEVKSNTPDRWTKTYETQWRNVDIDVGIDIPNVEAFPIIRVKYADPVPENMYGSFQVKENGRNDFDQGMFRGEKGSFVGSLKDWKNVRARETIVFTEKPLADYPDNTGVELSEIMKPFTGEIPEITAENLSLTAQEAYGKAISELESVLGTRVDSLRLTGFQVVSCYYKYHETENGLEWKEPQNKTGYYLFELAQVYEGIDYHSGDHFKSSVQYDGPNFERGSVSLITDGNGYTLVVSGLYDLIDKPYPDVPLVSFDKIIEELEGDIMSGNIRRIDKVKLCYYGYHDPNDNSVVWLLPTWIVESVYCEKPDEEVAENTYNKMGELINVTQKRAYVINAQTGEMLDRNSKSKERRNVPGIITWETTVQ